MAAHQAGILQGGGGHAMAAGLSIKQDKLSDFAAFMNEAFAKQVGALPPPSLKVVMVQPLSACTKQMVDWLDVCAPFGPSFSEPRLLLKNVMIKNARWIGSEKQHYSCELTDGTGAKLRAICFSLRDKLSNPAMLEQCDGRFFHLVGKLKADDYRGGDAIQMMIDDLVFANSE